jgi:transcriptional repressor NrdR
VLESRRAEEGAALRRRRRCTKCQHRFTTYERPEPEPLQVIKRSGERQPFDRAKLTGGLVRASHKRDVDPRDLELIVDGIEEEGRAAAGELSAERIGEMCLEGLRRLDHGAYLQFAGTLPDEAESPRNLRESKGPSSVRVGEDALVSTPKDEVEGDI